MPKLSQAELESLRRLAGRIIPASPAYGAPGADDAAIFSEIATALQSGPAPLAELLADFADGASEAGSEAQLDRLRQRHAAAFAAVIVAVAQAYYRDDRVMRSLGMEPRPPFPGGYDVAQGDWALLDTVRDRGPFWRTAN